jgi:hypothetical protein
MGRRLGKAKPPDHPMGTPFQAGGNVTHHTRLKDRIAKPRGSGVPNVGQRRK